MTRRSSRSRIANVTGVMTAFVCTFAAGQTPSPQDPPDAIVAHLLTHPHGLAWLSDEDQALLDAVKREPGRFVEAVTKALRLPDDDAALADADKHTRVERALVLARELGAENGRGPVRTLFTQASQLKTRHADTPDIRPEGDTTAFDAKRHVLGLRRLALDVLAAFKDDHFADAVLESVEREDLATQVVMLRYLEQAAAGKAGVHERLSRMVDDERSSLHRNPAAINALRAIKASADHSPGNAP